jgi:hypothetical protein
VDKVRAKRRQTQIFHNKIKDFGRPGGCVLIVDFIGFFVGTSQTSFPYRSVWSRHRARST